MPGESKESGETRKTIELVDLKELVLIDKGEVGCLSKRVAEGG